MNRSYNCFIFSCFIFNFTTFLAKHIISYFLKAVFHQFYLVHSWTTWPIWWCKTHFHCVYWKENVSKMHYNWLIQCKLKLMEFFLQSLREKCPNTELFLVRIFLYRTECSVQPFHAVQSFLMFWIAYFKKSNLNSFPLGKNNLYLIIYWLIKICEIRGLVDQSDPRPSVPAFISSMNLYSSRNSAWQGIHFARE